MPKNDISWRIPDWFHAGFLPACDVRMTGIIDDINKRFEVL
jgi:hypothetical protein